MKATIIALVLLLLLLQYKLWFEETGINQYRRLKAAVAAQTEKNTALKQRNQALAADIKDLKHGSEAIEERARQDLGMVKQNETYYQIVD
jgi:cell division protein FtsB